jgi:hypothetical protein
MRIVQRTANQASRILRIAQRTKSIVQRASCCACLVAAGWANAGEWSFVYQGTVEFNPLFGTDGKFTGEDTNGDGVISIGEVGSLSFFGHDIVPGIPMNLPGIDLVSGISKFSFVVATGQLDFDCIGGTWNDVMSKEGQMLSYSQGWQSHWTLTLVGTPEVTQRMFPQQVPQPVPEPATYAMMLLGLAVVAKRWVKS